MQVFKLYFKLLKSVAPALIIYLIIFLILIFIYASNLREEITVFEEAKIDTALVNYDGDDIFVRDFLEYLSGYCNFKDYGDNESNLADALFFREVEYILIIPYEFGKDFLAGKDTGLQKKALPDGVYHLPVDHAINNYLNIAGIYLDNMPNISAEDLVSYIRKDMKANAEVSILRNDYGGSENSFYNRYFNTASYIMLSCCLIGVGLVLLNFHDVDILRRNLVTPMTHKDMNLQLIGGNLIFVFAYDIFFILLGFLIHKEKSLNGNVLLFWLNFIIFSVSALSISYLAAMLVKSRQASTAISYVLPLGLSFISGAFVPQFLLGESVLKLASFTPFYWFVKANDTISGLVNFHWNNLKFVVFYMMIQLGFAAAIFSLSLVAGKSRRRDVY